MKDDLYLVLLNSILNKENYSGIGYPSIIEEICKNNNLEFSLDSDYNGWCVDWWATINKNTEKYCDISGSMYYGSVEINFN